MEAPPSPAVAGATTIAEAIRRDPLAATRLDALSRRLGCGAGSLSRRPVAELVRFDDAAAILGLPTDTLIDVALGRQAVDDAVREHADRTPRVADTAAEADWFSLAESRDCPRLDVRPLLAAACDPLSAVLEVADTVGLNEFFLVDAPFDPAPLRRVLAKRGFTSVGRPIGDRHWRICLRRTQPALPPDDDEPLHDHARWQDTDGHHLDVRGLLPPRPVMEILAVIDAGGIDQLVVHHDREPHMLFPLLRDRGWECAERTWCSGTLRLTLRRAR